MVVLFVAVSLGFFACAFVLLERSRTKPPAAIRTESRRSAAEYAFHQKCALMRRRGLLFMLAGLVNLATCAGFAAMAALAP